MRKGREGKGREAGREVCRGACLFGRPVLGLDFVRKGQEEEAEEENKQAESIAERTLNEFRHESSYARESIGFIRRR